jgi:uncharacterized protein (DUF2147 family)
MKKIISILFLFVSMIINAQHHKVIGKWKTIDDITGKAKSIVEIYEKSGKFYGKVVDIIEDERKKDLCVNCSGEDKDRPIVGMTIIKGLLQEGNEYTSGKILDPKSGKLYKCYIVVEEHDLLKVRGYIGFSMLGRTQYWHRVKGSM